MSSRADGLIADRHDQSPCVYRQYTIFSYAGGYGWAWHDIQKWRERWQTDLRKLSLASLTAVGVRDLSLHSAHGMQTHTHLGELSADEAFTLLVSMSVLVCVCACGWV